VSTGAQEIRSLVFKYRRRARLSPSARWESGERRGLAGAPDAAAEPQPARLKGSRSTYATDSVSTGAQEIRSLVFKYRRRARLSPSARWESGERRGLAGAPD